ncbi:MAG TPA: hypothetical protein VL527_06615 [Dongiaceae bacterium]|nr:hypothetical protein [Dongiaceae bacterium]
MPEERDIEKQLRAAAAKRQAEAGTPFELHPVNRRALQDEVRRTRGPAPAPRRRSWLTLGLGWPRFATLTSLLAVAFLGVWMTRQNLRKPVTVTSLSARGETARTYDRALAANESKPAMPDRDRKLEPASPTVTYSDGKVDGFSAPEQKPGSGATDWVVDLPASKDKKTALAKHTEAPAMPPPAAMPAPLPAPTLPAAAPELPAPPVTSAPILTDAALPAPPPLATPTAPGLATHDIQQVQAYQNNMVIAGGRVDTWDTSDAGVHGARALQSEGAVRAQFTGDQTRSSAPAATTGTLLTSFKVEQNGDQLRIVDHDGSVYTGNWAPAPSPGSTNAPALYADYGAVAAPTQLHDQVKNLPADAVSPPANTFTYAMAQQNFRFAATGTNRSLQQNVVLSGEIVALNITVTNALSNGAVNLSGNFKNNPQGNLQSQQLMPKNSQYQLPLLNSRIVGTAVLGNGQQVQLNATPTPKP